MSSFFRCYFISPAMGIYRISRVGRALCICALYVPYMYVVCKRKGDGNYIN